MLRHCPGNTLKVRSLGSEIGSRSLNERRVKKSAPKRHPNSTISPPESFGATSFNVSADTVVAISISGHKTDSVFRRYNIIYIEDKKEATQKVADYNSKHRKAASE